MAFKVGFKAVREETVRAEKRREEGGKKLWRFFFGKGVEDVMVRFLTETPVTFMEHTYPDGKSYGNTICHTEDGEPCSYCDSGDRPTFHGALLVYDYTTYKDKDGKQKEVGLKMYIRGSQDLSKLDKAQQRYGLTNRDYLITRTGTGTSTSYSFDRQDESDIPDKINKAILARYPEYDGSEDFLIEVVKEQLSYYEPNVEDEATAKSSYNQSVIGVDDDDEEDEAPKKKSMFNAKRKESQVKNLRKKKQV